MSNANVSDAKRLTARKRARWVVYPALVAVTVLVFAVSALFYLGTFSRLRDRAVTPQERQAVARLSQASGVPASQMRITASPEAYATPQTYAVWWQAIRGGDWRGQARMQRAGRVISLPAGTPIWYQPLAGRSGLTPVRLLGSKYAGRTYWVEGDYLSPHRQMA